MLLGIVCEEEREQPIHDTFETSRMSKYFVMDSVFRDVILKV